MIPFWLQDIHARLTPLMLVEGTNLHLWKDRGGLWNLRQSKPCAIRREGFVFF